MPRLLRVAPWLVPLLALLIGVLAPSTHLHPDALDELHRFELGTPHRTPGHPLGEPLLVAWVRALAGTGLPVARCVQLWNAGWMAAALAGLVALGRRRGSAPLLVAAVPGALASTYAALHLLRDPYLPDWPPALALMSWAAVVSWPVGRAGLLAGAAVLLPPTLAAAPALAERRERLVVGVPALVCGVAIAAAWGHPEAGVARPATDLLAPLRGLAGAFTAQERGFGALDVLAHPTSPAAWATAGALALVVGGGVLGLVRRPAVSTEAKRFLLGAAAVALFLLVWGPDQPRFWLLPLWMLGMAALVSPARDLGPTLAGLAGLLLVSNGARYLLPTTGTPDPRVTTARALAERFGPADLLLFAGGARPHVDYYGGLRTDGLDAAGAGAGCEALRGLATEVEAGGGGLYLVLDAPTQCVEGANEKVAGLGVARVR